MEEKEIIYCSLQSCLAGYGAKEEESVLCITLHAFFFFYCEQMKIEYQDAMQIHESSTKGLGGRIFGKRHSRRPSITQIILGAHERGVDHMVKILTGCSLQHYFSWANRNYALSFGPLS